MELKHTPLHASGQRLATLLGPLRELIALLLQRGHRNLVRTDRDVVEHCTRDGPLGLLAALVLYEQVVLRLKATMVGEFGKDALDKSSARIDVTAQPGVARAAHAQVVPPATHPQHGQLAAIPLNVIRILRGVDSLGGRRDDRLGWLARELQLRAQPV